MYVQNIEDWGNVRKLEDLSHFLLSQVWSVYTMNITTAGIHF